MNYHWNWGIFLEASPDGAGTYLYTLYLGLRWTLATAFSAWVLALAIGTLVGVMRTLPSRPAQWLGRLHVEVFRNIPFIVQLFLWYFVLPEVLPATLGLWLKQLPNASFFTTVVALAFYMSARIAEQLRAGLGALAQGQAQAGIALGLTTVQIYRLILLPMAFRIILPTLTSDTLNTIKNTSIALTIGLVELTSRAHTMQEQSFQFFEAFTAVTVIYIVVNGLVTLAMRRLERHVAIPGFVKGK
jgi:glutamate/aspartate transport system permease protein